VPSLSSELGVPDGIWDAVMVMAWHLIGLVVSAALPDNMGALNIVPGLDGLVVKKENPSGETPF
jgi:hypothetical protein